MRFHPMSRIAVRQPLVLALVLAGCVHLAGSAVAPALADVLIVSSSTPSLRPGTQLADAERIDVPANARVRVLLPSGATLTLNGPVNRLVKDITKGEPIVETVWAKAKELFVTGGADVSRPGATRSLAQARPPETPFSWSLVGRSAVGNVCVEKGVTLEVERPATGPAPAAVVIIDAATAKRETLSFQGDAPRAPWPAAMPLQPGATYQLIAGAQAPRTIQVRLVDKAATAEASALRTLIENDCRQQARAFVRL